MDKKALFLILLMLLVTTSSYAQRRPQSSAAVFVFHPVSDLYPAPSKENGEELKRLLQVIEQYRSYIESGQMQIRVEGYCFHSLKEQENLEIAHSISNRLKSVIISRTGLNRNNVITSNHATTYGGWNDLGVVTLQSRRTLQTLRTELPPPYRDGTQPSRRVGDISLRTNLLYWAALAPNLGAEWRPGLIGESVLSGYPGRLGILLNGAWTSITWDNRNRKYRWWTVNPEIRWYIDSEQRWYAGVEFHTGQYNMKFGDTGRQGRYNGGGITGGYYLPLSRYWGLDFSLALGYTGFRYDKYERIDNQDVRSEQHCRTNYWGPTQAGVTLRYNW